MKNLAVTIVVNLFLLSSSTVVAMPHALNTGFQRSLSTRHLGQQVRHSLLSGRMTETASKGLFKRGNVDDNSNEDSYNDDGDSDDDEDECSEDSSDSSYAEHQSTPNLHTPYRIGLNSSASTNTHPQKSKPPARNFSAETSSSKPANSAEVPRSSSYEPAKNKHHVDSQKYDVPTDKYASDSVKQLGHHGFVSSYDGYHGKATFFTQGGSAGACGKVHEDSDYVVAIQSQLYSGGKFCGKTVLVTRKSTGKSIKCVAADECPGCPTDQSLDLSIAAFNALGSPDEGVFDIHWQVMD